MSARHVTHVAQEPTVVARDSVRARCSCGWYGTPFLANEYDEARRDGRAHEREERGWAALDAVPCAHAIPGTCDRC